MMRIKVICVVFLALMAMVVCSTAEAADWEQSTGILTARDQFAAGVIGRKLYVFGGNGNPDGFNLSSLEVYDTLTDTWSFGPSNSHNGGNGAEELTGVVMNGKFYVFGAWGGGNPYGVFNFNEEYDPATEQWRSLAAKPTTVASAPAAVYNGEIYVFGGYYKNDLSEEETHYTAVEAYNPMSNSWRTVTHMPFALENMAVSVYKDTAYLIGGLVSQGGQIAIQTDVIAYHFLTDTWTATGLGSLQGFHGFTYQTPAPVINGRIYLVGGIGVIDPDGPLAQSNATPVSDVLIYDTETHTFS